MSERSYGRDGATGAEGRAGTTGERGLTGRKGEKGDPGSDTRNPAVWALAFALVLCFSLLAVSVHRNATAIQTATKALCSEKIDITVRLSQTNEFLKRMGDRQSISLGGVVYSKADLISQQHQLQRQNANLKGVTCK